MLRFFFTLFFGITLFFPGVNTLTYAQEKKSTQIYEFDWEDENRIPGLEWISKDFKIEKKDKRYRAYVIYVGKYTNPDRSLIYQLRKVRLDEEQTFTIVRPLQSKETKLHFVSVGIKGDLQNETPTVLFPGYEKLMAYREKPAPKRWYFSVGAGVSSLSYQEGISGATPSIDFSQLSMTGKIGATYKLGKRWDLGLNSYFTLFDLSSDAPASASFFGANLRIGYVVTPPTSKWRISLMSGFYYASMSVADQAFGYSGVAGPQLFPVFSTSLSKDRTLVSYLKFSPISDKLGILDLGSNEIAAGAAYVTHLSATKTLSYTLDYAQLSINLKDSSGTEVEIANRSISLGISYGF